MGFVTFVLGCFYAAATPKAKTEAKVPASGKIEMLKKFEKAAAENKRRSRNAGCRRP